VAGELPNAEHAFMMADRCWNEAASMGDVLGYEAKILALKASLRRTQGRFSLAIALLDRALLADPKGALRPEILVSKAFTLGESGDLDGAALVLREAIKTIHPESTPRLFFILHHNLLDALSKAGHFEEARGLLPEVETLAEKAGEPIDILRISWVKARVAAAEGDRARAAELFEETRRGFLKEGIVLDAALAALELSYLYLSEGKADLVVEIARDLLSVFETQDVPRETLATLAAFCRAAEAKVATAELARWAKEALEVAGRNRVALPEAVH
jgi:tetratricopeptide (TPR) repeat protein